MYRGYLLPAARRSLVGEAPQQLTLDHRASSLPHRVTPAESYKMISPADRSAKTMPAQRRLDEPRLAQWALHLLWHNHIRPLQGMRQVLNRAWRSGAATQG